MSSLHALLIGDVDRTEFREAVAELRRMSEVVTARDMDGALAILERNDLEPDLIVVAQAVPGQFSAEAIDRLRGHAPLARVIGLLGSWCEGEVRTGKPWPAATRVYWHQWRPRCRRELRRLAAGHSSSWSLPVTASEEEQFLAVVEEPLVRRAGLIGIHSLEYEVQDWLARACRRRGYGTVWLEPGRSPVVGGVSAVIFDFGGRLDNELADLKAVVHRLRPAPAVALANFPRLDERDQILAAGAASVLSKPLLLADLFEELDSLLGPPEAHSFI